MHPRVARNAARVAAVMALTVPSSAGTIMAGEKKATRMLQRVSKLLLLAFPLLLASCGGTVLHDFRAIDGSVWSRYDTLRFCYDGSFDKNAAGYDLWLEARTDAAYPYKNLVARVECRSLNDSSLVAVDTLCCVIFGEDGHRKGSTAGILYQVSSGSMSVDAKGGDTLVVHVSHIMEPDELEGVSDIGIRLGSSYAHGQRQSSEISPAE